MIFLIVISFAKKIYWNPVLNFFQTYSDFLFKLFIIERTNEVFSG